MSDETKKKIAFVTGATGFVGTHLTRRLIHDGWDVHTIIRPGGRLPDGPQTTKLILHHYDGSTEGIVSLLGNVRPTVVFHLASLFLSQHRENDIEPLIRSNVLFGTQLIEAMNIHGIHRLINTGTSWQYFDNKSYDPVCLYAATKQAFEAILSYYTNATPVSAVTLILYDTYGPGDRRQKLFSLLKNAADTGKTLAMSPGEQLIDLVYIDDVVNAFMIAAERLMNGMVQTHEKYAVSSGNPISLRDLVSLYARAIEKQLPVAWGQRAYRPREVMVPWNQGCSLPGWRPCITLEEGIKKAGEPV